MKQSNWKMLLIPPDELFHLFRSELAKKKMVFGRLENTFEIVSQYREDNLKSFPCISGISIFVSKFI